jgi:hypothetical protein
VFIARVVVSVCAKEWKIAEFNFGSAGGTHRKSFGFDGETIVKNFVDGKTFSCNFSCKPL